MRYFIFIFIVIVISRPIKSQSYSYEIESYQDTFESLEGYISLFIENEGDFSFEKRFELNFDFPYYDRIYNYLNFDSQSWANFDDSDYVMGLLGFGYEPDNLLDTANLISDVRYKYLTKNGLQALAIEFTKNRLHNDLSIDEFDSSITFQVWFYETGDIEIRFGDINLDNSPSYVSGEGFYLITSDSSYLSGPAVGIDNPDDIDDSIWLDGAYNDFDTVTNIGYLTVLPPKGWVIRFSRQETAVNDIKGLDFRVYPNPFHDFIQIESDYNIDQIDIFTLDNIPVKSIKKMGKGIFLGDLAPGVYLAKINSGRELVWKKLIKIE